MQLATKARLLILFILLAAGLSELSFDICNYGIIGNGYVVTKDRVVHDFTTIDVHHAFQVIVTQTGECRVKVEADENLQGNIITTVKGGVLTIKANQNRENVEKMTIHVSVDQLNGVRASGASHIKGINVITSNELDMNASGASYISLAVEVDDLAVTASGASRVKLSGAIDKGYVDVSGAAHAKMKELNSQDMEITASGASKVYVNVAKSLEISASGASKVRYMGGAAITDIAVSGAGSVKQLDTSSTRSSGVKRL